MYRTDAMLIGNGPKGLKTPLIWFKNFSWGSTMSDQNNIKELLQKAHEAVLADAESQMSAQDKALHAVSKCRVP